MNFDDWKQSTPDSYDYEEDKECAFCGVEIPDGKTYCSKDCQRAYYAEN